MIDTTRINKVLVTLNEGFTCFNDSSSGFFINYGEKKEATLNKNIKKALDDKILIKTTE